MVVFSIQSKLKENFIFINASTTIISKIFKYQIKNLDFIIEQKAISVYLYILLI